MFSNILINYLLRIVYKDYFIFSIYIMSKEIISNRIQELTPDVKPSTLKTFTTNLNSLFYYSHDKKTNLDLDWFSNHSEVDDSIKHRPKTSQKTLYASLLRILPKDEYYKKKMTELGIEIKNDLSNQEKNVKQEEAWKTTEEIQSIYDDLYNRAKPFLNSKTEVSDKDLKNVIDLVMFALTSGLFIAPRRSMDWTEMKIKNVDKEKDNYIDKNDFVFNAYKTSKNGSIQQRVPIPKTLKALLNKAIKVNKYDYLLVSTTGEKLSSIIITQRLNKLFGSKTSTSMLRHIYLSNVYKDVPALKEMKELADNMGHDVSTALQYVKK